MAEMTFYPDAHPESTSVDGRTIHKDISGLTWAEVIAGVGNLSDDEGVDIHVARMVCLDDFDEWDFIERGIIVLDISELPPGAIISAVALILYGYGKIDTFPTPIAPDTNVYSSAPASNIAVVAGDFNSLGSTPYCDTPITYPNWKIGTPGDPNIFVFNAVGIAAAQAAADGDGILPLGMRNANYDVAGIDPGAVAEKHADLYCWSADKGGDHRPELIVTYVEPRVGRSHGYIFG